MKKMKWFSWTKGRVWLFISLSRVLSYFISLFFFFLLCGAGWLARKDNDESFSRNRTEANVRHAYSSLWTEIYISLFGGTFLSPFLVLFTFSLPISFNVSFSPSISHFRSIFLRLFRSVSRFLPLFLFSFSFLSPFLFLLLSSLSFLFLPLFSHHFFLISLFFLHFLLHLLLPLSFFHLSLFSSFSIFSHHFFLLPSLSSPFSLSIPLLSPFSLPPSIFSPAPPVLPRSTRKPLRPRGARAWPCEGSEVGHTRPASIRAAEGGASPSARVALPVGFATSIAKTWGGEICKSVRVQC